MFRSLARPLSWACLLLAFWTTRLAFAVEEERRVVVVDVREAAHDLDAEALRQRIGAELQADTVPPSDPRAPMAHGTITIDADHDQHELSVRYDGHGEPTVRRIPLPSEPDVARQAVVFLAGNLARDEATAMASELRKSAVVGEGNRETTVIAKEENPNDRSASKPRSTTATWHPSDNELRIEALGGNVFATGTTYGMQGGGMISFRHKNILLAPSVTWASTWFNGSQRDLRIGAGATFTLPRFVRLELLGVGGVHEYRNFAESIFNSGANGTRTFLGIWAGLSAVFLRHFTTGAWLYYEGDLNRTKEANTINALSLGRVDGRLQVGQDAFGVLYRLGVMFD